jgi:hypothetical protein
MTKAEQVRLTAWRLRVLRQAADDGNVARICRAFGISRRVCPEEYVSPRRVCWFPTSHVDKRSCRES